MQCCKDENGLGDDERRADKLRGGWLDKIGGDGIGSGEIGGDKIESDEIGSDAASSAQFRDIGGGEVI